MPEDQLSKSQIDRLGDRLRKGDVSESDLRLLEDYRRSFTESYDYVVERIRSDLSLAPTGRRAKSTKSIIDKLRREGTRLSTMQDMAGCRIVVSDMLRQDEAVVRLEKLFPNSDRKDRREKPSHGYRAVHLIVSHVDKLVEIQIRTSLQQSWAELSEKVSDVVDPSIKYGSGDEESLFLLGSLSRVIAEYETNELRLTLDAQKDFQSEGPINEVPKNALTARKQDIIDFLTKASEVLLRAERTKHDLSD